MRHLAVNVAHARQGVQAKRSSYLWMRALRLGRQLVSPTGYRAYLCAGRLQPPPWEPGEGQRGSHQTQGHPSRRLPLARVTGEGVMDKGRKMEGREEQRQRKRAYQQGHSSEML